MQNRVLFSHNAQVHHTLSQLFNLIKLRHNTERN